MSESQNLSALASWWRELAEEADEPRIWHARMRTAETFDAKAEEQRIRERAYSIWLDEGRPEGRADEHWRRAAAEVALSKSAGVTDDGKLLGPSADDPAILLPRKPR